MPGLPTRHTGVASARVSHLSDETTYNDLMPRMVASLNKCD